MSRGYSAKGHDIEDFYRGEIEAWGGIACAFVSDWAEFFDCTPDDVLDAVERARIDLLVDTSVDHRDNKDNPATAPNRRALGMTSDDVEKLAQTLRGKGEGESGITIG
jgi:hypothetical protein